MLNNTESRCLLVPFLLSDISSDTHLVKAMSPFPSSLSSLPPSFVNVCHLSTVTIKKQDVLDHGDTEAIDRRSALRTLTVRW